MRSRFPPPVGHRTERDASAGRRADPEQDRHRRRRATRRCRRAPRSRDAPGRRRDPSASSAGRRARTTTVPGAPEEGHPRHGRDDRHVEPPTSPLPRTGATCRVPVPGVNRGARNQRDPGPGGSTPRAGQPARRPREAAIATASVRPSAPSLAEDVADVHARGLLADVERGADLPVGAPLGHQRQHLLLAGREHRRRLGPPAHPGQVDVEPPPLHQRLDRRRAAAPRPAAPPPRARPSPARRRPPDHRRPAAPRPAASGSAPARRRARSRSRRPPACHSSRRRLAAQPCRLGLDPRQPRLRLHAHLPDGLREDVAPRPGPTSTSGSPTATQLVGAGDVADQAGRGRRIGDRGERRRGQPQHPEVVGGPQLPQPARGRLGDRAPRSAGRPARPPGRPPRPP